MHVKLIAAAALTAATAAHAQVFTSLEAYRSAAGPAQRLVTCDDLPEQTTLATQYANIGFGGTVRTWNAITQGGGGTAVSPPHVLFNFGTQPMVWSFDPPARSMAVYNPSIHDRVLLTLKRADDTVIQTIEMPSGAVTFAGYLAGDDRIARVQAEGVPGFSNFTIFLDDLEWSIYCTPDIGITGGIPGHDDVLDNNDFVVFIDYFFAANPIADVGSTGGVPGSDGAFDNNDFIVYIDYFFGLC